jgi:hypothetical protein
VDASTEGHLVLFESQFVVFATLMAKAVTGAADRLPTAPRLFTDVLVAYATAGRPGAVGPFLPVADRGSSASLASAMFLFMIAHEYAHAVLGHVGEARRRPGLLSEDDDTRTLVYSWRHVLDADVIGVRLAVEAAARDGVELATVLRGADLLLSSLEVMDRAVALLHAGDETALQLGPHPPGSMRRTSLRRLVPQMAGIQSRDAVSAAVAAAERQARDVEELWVGARSVLTRHRAEDVSVHFCWHLSPVADVFTHDE